MEISDELRQHFWDKVEVQSTGTIWGLDEGLAAFYLAAREAESMAMRAASNSKDALDLAAFARDCIRTAFEGSCLEGPEIEELGVRCGLVKRVAFDPSVHVDPMGYSEKGDPWITYTDEFRSTLMDKG